MHTISKVDLINQETYQHKSCIVCNFFKVKIWSKYLSWTTLTEGEQFLGRFHRTNLKIPLLWRYCGFFFLFFFMLEMNKIVIHLNLGGSGHLWRLWVYLSGVTNIQTSEGIRWKQNVIARPYNWIIFLTNKQTNTKKTQ